MDNAFRSTNLIYRAIEDNDEDRAFVFEKISSDPVIAAQAFAGCTPASKKAANDLVKTLTGDAILLAVMICLPAKPAEPAEPDQAGVNGPGAPTPIGFVNLTAPRRSVPANRNTMVGISLVREHQGKGYGTEAINWAVDWAFVFGGMHKVAIGAGSFNPGAERLYKRLGFIEEGRIRHDIWFGGQWHDRIEMGMLKEEWRALRGTARS